MENNIVLYKKFFPSWVVAGTTTKSFGDMKTIAKQKKLASFLHVSWPGLHSLIQQHTAIIWDEKNVKSNTVIGDGFLTERKNQVLLVKTADCVPVILVEEKKKLAMILHAGLKGLQLQIVELGISTILKRGGQVRNIKVLLGPFIEEKCYGNDLDGMAREQLRKYGIDTNQIFSTGICTYCNNNQYFSFRHGDTERMATFVKIL